MKRKMDILLNGIFRENPVLILILGCCSTLAISVTVLGSLGMGAAPHTLRWGEGREIISLVAEEQV